MSHNGPDGDRSIYSSILSLTSWRDEGVVSATPQPFYPRERPGTHCIEGRVAPRAGLDGRRKISPPPGFDPRTVHPTDLSRSTRSPSWETNTDISAGQVISTLLVECEGSYPCSQQPARHWTESRPPPLRKIFFSALKWLIPKVSTLIYYAVCPTGYYRGWCRHWFCVGGSRVFTVTLVDTSFVRLACSC
jgi:hypothetical protein